MLLRELGDHLDLSVKNAREWLLQSGHSADEPMDVLRVAYIQGLREVAAGRGGAAGQAAMVEAKTRDLEAATRLKEVQYLEKIGLLVPADELDGAVDAAFMAVRNELGSLSERCAAVAEQVLRISVDADIFAPVVSDTLSHLVRLSADDAEGDESEVEDVQAA